MISSETYLSAFGGFPLAAVRNGITPVWASEIEAFPIEVTKHHFPDMVHVGDIIKLDGTLLPPVDIICGGSPCQDCLWPERVPDWPGRAPAFLWNKFESLRRCEMRTNDLAGQVSMFARDLPCGRMCPDASPVDETPKRGGKHRDRTSSRSSRRSSRLKNQSFMLLNLRSGAGNILGPYWEIDPPWLGCDGTLNTSECPRDAAESSLSAILQENAPSKYYLTRKACLGILRRAWERGRELPRKLKAALLAQAGLVPLPGPMSESAPPAANRRNADDCLNPWDTQQARIFTPEGTAPTLAGADGGGGRNPGGLLFTAGFCAGASPAAGSIGYQEEISPTLKASASGNMMPSVLCLNDQGGSAMEYSEDVAGTLRAQEHGHQPLILSEKPHQEAMLFENHGIDARYTGPHPIAPTLSARAGTGGNNLPLVAQEGEALCILGNTVDCAPEHGGHGLGIQEGIAYTLTSEHCHAVFTRQRSDQFQEGDVASTESAQQDKDATDLIYQAAEQADAKEPALHCAAELPRLIRRLTPLECERLQGLC